MFEGQGSLTAAAFQVHRRPPPLYRLARALRRASLAVLLLLILFTASVAYSAVETAQSSSSLSPVGASFVGNGTLLISETLTLGNNGFYEVQGLTLSARVANATGVPVGAAQAGPTNLPSQATGSYPLNIYLPVSGTGPGPSLLTQDQSLPVALWANATFGYLFPIGLALSETRSWGAPFDDLQFSVGPPTVSGNSTTVPVALSFQNHAPFTETGALNFAVHSSGGATCGAGSFVLDVPAGSPFAQTDPVTLANGCSPVGGFASGAFVTPSYTVPLPSEPIP